MYSDRKRVHLLPSPRMQFNLPPVFTVTIAVGLQDRPASAPQTGPWESDFKIVGNPSFTEAITAISSLIFAYAGTPGFFSIVSEMRDPRHYTRSLICCQVGVTATYIIIGCVVYYYCGSYVASPALGSAGVLLKKVSYGFALPGLFVTTTIVVHVSTLYRLAAITNVCIDPREVPFRPNPTWVQASHWQHTHTLGLLVGMYWWRRIGCLCYRQCNPSVWRSRLACRCLARYPNVFPAHGLHVVVR